MPQRPTVNRRPVLLFVALACTIAFVGVWAIGVRTRWGQRLDATALSGRDALNPRAVRAAGELLDTISVASLVLVGGLIVLVALARRRPLLGLGAGAVIAGAVVTTEVLKFEVLQRPNLGIVDPLGLVASYPSGHTTVAFSLGMAALLVAPSRLRTAVGLLGALYGASIGVAVVSTANHRPSDPIGAALVVTGWAAAIAAVMPMAPIERVREGRATVVSPLLLFSGAMLLVLAFVGLVGTGIAIRSDRLGAVEVTGAFVAACTAVTGTILFGAATLLACLRGVSLDPPASELVQTSEPVSYYRPFVEGDERA
jgi:membrane-associated phospholipid phosphatase